MGRSLQADRGQLLAKGGWQLSRLSQVQLLKGVQDLVELVKAGPTIWSAAWKWLLRCTGSRTWGLIPS
jgi:hypothetical protein